MPTEKTGAQSTIQTDRFCRHKYLWGFLVKLNSLSKLNTCNFLKRLHTETQQNLCCIFLTNHVLACLSIMKRLGGEAQLGDRAVQLGPTYGGCRRSQQSVVGCNSRCSRVGFQSTMEDFSSTLPLLTPVTERGGR